MKRLVLIICMTIFLSNCQTTSTVFNNTNNSHKVNLEMCLDKFFGPLVPIGKIDKYNSWVMFSSNSMSAKKNCLNEISQFINNAPYQIDKRFLSDEMWVKAMVIYKNSFKPNQTEGKKKLFNPHGDPIGKWWAIPIGVVK